MDLGNDISECASEIGRIEEMLELAKNDDWAVMLEIKGFEIGCCHQRAIVNLLKVELQERIKFLHAKPNNWE